MIITRITNHREYDKVISSCHVLYFIRYIIDQCVERIILNIEENSLKILPNTKDLMYV